jgi:ribonucleoside-diphosphate reductase alpha chain
MQIVEDVQQMLSSVGIRSYYTTNKPVVVEFRNGPYECKESYDINISTDKEIFADIIGFIQPYKTEKLEEICKSPKRALNKSYQIISKEFIGVHEVFDITVDCSSHTYWTGGLLVANCGEQPLHPWDSCNLGSINLAKMVWNDTLMGKLAVDWKLFKETIHTAVRFLDNVISINDYPVPEMREMADKTRRIGLGIMGWADMLFQLGIAYDSEEARELAREVGCFLRDEAQHASMALAEERGSFDAWEGSIWDKNGIAIRNSHHISFAPTGTISIIAGCSGGVEPMFALAFERNVLADDTGKPTTMWEINPWFEKAIYNLTGNKDKELNIYKPILDDAIEYVKQHGTITNFDWTCKGTDGEAFAGVIVDECLEIQKIIKVFKTAHEIAPEDHLKMQAAWQESVDTSISKTINFSKDAEVEEIDACYKQAHKLGCKGVSVYRDGCRDGVEGMVQPMKAGTKEYVPVARTEEELLEKIGPPDPIEPFIPEKSEKKSEETKGIPVLDPDIADGQRVRFQTQFGTMHVKIFLDTTMRYPMEVFAQIGKGGFNINADLEGMCRLMSIQLQKGADLQGMISQLRGIGSMQYAPGPGGKIYSLPDALAQALTKWKKYHDDDDVAEDNATALADKFDSSYGIPCPSCKSGIIVIEEQCKKCYSCGWSQC